jgi:hypothetical protein
LAKNPADATHITYVGIDKVTGKYYVGYASMPGVRTSQEVLKYRYSGVFERFEVEPEILFAGYGDKATARGLEQRTFEKLGGLEKTANHQLPVGPRNPRMDEYLKAADEHRAKTRGCK